MYLYSIRIRPSSRFKCGSCPLGFIGNGVKCTRNGSVMQNTTLSYSNTNDLSSIDINKSSGNDISDSHLSDPCLRYVCFNICFNSMISIF